MQAKGVRPSNVIFPYKKFGPRAIDLSAHLTPTPNRLRLNHTPSFLFHMHVSLLRKSILSLFIAVMALLAGGCASITRGTKDKLQVLSEPTGAQVTLSTGQTGTTPVTFKLPRKKGVIVEVAKPGYHTEKVVVSSKFAAGGGVALAGNALVGGLIGAGIDGLSGATLSLKPNPVSVTLRPLEPAAAPAESQVAPTAEPPATSPTVDPAAASAALPDQPAAPASGA